MSEPTATLGEPTRPTPATEADPHPMPAPNRTQTPHRTKPRNQATEPGHSTGPWNRATQTSEPNEAPDATAEPSRRTGSAGRTVQRDHRTGSAAHRRTRPSTQPAPTGAGPTRCRSAPKPDVARTQGTRPAPEAATTSTKGRRKQARERRPGAARKNQQRTVTSQTSHTSPKRLPSEPPASHRPGAGKPAVGGARRAKSGEHEVLTSRVDAGGPR